MKSFHIPFDEAAISKTEQQTKRPENCFSGLSFLHKEAF